MFLQEKEYATHALNGCPPASNCSSFIEPRKPDKLNNRDILRYSRQLILPEIGVKGMGLFKTNVNYFQYHVYGVFDNPFISKVNYYWGTKCCYNSVDENLNWLEYFHYMPALSEYLGVPYNLFNLMPPSNKRCPRSIAANGSKITNTGKHRPWINTAPREMQQLLEDNKKNLGTTL